MLTTSVSKRVHLFTALQKHYKNLEALALDRDEPEEVIDLTGELLLSY